MVDEPMAGKQGCCGALGSADAHVPIAVEAIELAYGIFRSRGVVKPINDLLKIAIHRRRGELLKVRVVIFAKPGVPRIKTVDPYDGDSVS